MAPTIAERAANGEILHAPDLTRDEQAELLLWARSQENPLSYEDIKKIYGFTQKADTLRWWHMNMKLDKPPPKATFTAEDDRLLLRAVQLFATGPLDDPKSLIGVWKKAKAYIRENGGTTTAGDVKLKERWHILNGLPVPSSKRAKRGARARGASATSQARSIIRTEPSGALARSFPVVAGQNQPDSSAQPATVMDWEEYPPLSEGEMRDALGSKYAAEENKEQTEQNAPDMEWEDYPPLTEGELRQALGSDYSDYVREGDREQQQDPDMGQQQDPDMEWEEYEPLSEGEMRDALGSDYCGEEEDGDKDGDYEEN